MIYELTTKVRNGRNTGETNKTTVFAVWLVVGIVAMAVWAASRKCDRVTWREAFDAKRVRRQGERR